MKKLLLLCSIALHSFVLASQPNLKKSKFDDHIKRILALHAKEITRIATQSPDNLKVTDELQSFILNSPADASPLLASMLSAEKSKATTTKTTDPMFNSNNQSAAAKK